MAKPEIRLKGFKGEWEKMSFSEMVNRVATSGDTKTMPGVEFEDIISGEGVLNKDINNKKINKVGKCFEPGDVLFGKLRPYLKNILLADFKGVAIGDFWVLRPNKINSNLLYMLVSSNNFMKVANISSGSKMPRADWNLVFNSHFYIPKEKDEQKAISDYFKSLDSMIQGVTKKIASLKQMKQACLVSMFPQAGETTPRVRFKGFKDEWKSVCFGSLIKECLDRSVIENEDVLLSSSIEGMFLNSELFGHQRGRSNIGYKKIRKNMMILSAQNLHLGNANVNLRFDHGLVSPAYKIYDLIGCSPLFMYCWIKREEAKKFFLDATTAGASLCRKNIIWNDLYNQRIFMPSIEEQSKIGLFFTSLDKQISLQEARLEKLKQIKAACLDKMFV